MCLLAAAFRVHEEHPLIVTANRDEFYARPTRAMHWWKDAPILAGRDLEAGGTWLGLSRDGRFAALTNVRGSPPREGARSRGMLVVDFLGAAAPAPEWAQQMLESAGEYAGFNLIAYDGTALVCLSNQPPRVLALEPGVHVLGNAALGESWPKIEHAREQLLQSLGEADVALDRLLPLLSSRQTFAPHLLPDTGISREMEELLSSPFIVSEEYGTRASTALIVSRDGATAVTEQCFERGLPLAPANFAFMRGI